MPTTDKELLFNELLQPHWDKFAKEAKTIIAQTSQRSRVFISYAWPNARYPGYDAEKDIQPWLLGLYERLTDLGASVLFDIKSMMLGTNIDQFMQQGVDSCDAVLIIGTQTYKARSEEDTNVKREVEHIQQKIQRQGSNCVVPILYRGEFHNALPNLGQILGTNCSDEYLSQENLPTLIEGLFGLLNNAAYQALKQKYLTQISNIKAHGLSETAVADFAQNRANKARAALELQREVVNLMLERNAKGHPDYVARPMGSEPLSVKMLSSLKEKYGRYTQVQALFGEPMALEGQYINVQMLYQVLEEKREEEGQPSDDKEGDKNDKLNKEFKDVRVTSFETIFSKKEPLAINQLFTPAKQLLSEKQKTNEARPDAAPNFVLLQGRAGIGKTTFVNFVTRQWALGRLWSEYNWVFSLRFRDLRSGAIQQAAEKKETWTLSDWIYSVHFAAQMDKASFQPLWNWLIEPDLKSNKVLFVLDGYDEAPTQHPCEQALTDLLNSDTPKILTSRPYGLSDLPKDKRELEIVGFVDENVDKYVSLYFRHDENKAKAIAQGLRTSASLWGSAHIPVTLNVLCGVLETQSDIPDTLAKLNTMGGLYETMEMSLLERAYVTTPGKDKSHAAQLKPLDSSSKIELLTQHYQLLRQYLAKLAFAAFSKQQLILTPQDVTQVLKEFKVPVTEIADKIKELLDLGLLKKVVDETTHLDTNYEFLHLTFQEYYAGRYLLWQVEQGNQTLLEDFAKIKLDPRWQLVLWFVAGTIKDKDKYMLFMRALAHPQGSDMLGNVQLGLMIRCTEENWELAQETGWTKAVTQMLQQRILRLYRSFKSYTSFSVHGGLYDARDRDIRDRVFQLPVWVQMLNIGQHRYEKQTGELDLFASVSRDAKWIIFSNDECGLILFIHWLRLFSPSIMQTLFLLLGRSNVYVYCLAAEVFGRLDRAVATPEFLAQLMGLMADSRRDVRRSAAYAVGKLDQPAAISQFLAQLIRMMTDSRWDVRVSAVDAIYDLGALAATPDILAQLAKLLAGSDKRVCSSAAYAVGKLGAMAATPDFLMQLAKLLADRDENVRRSAAYAVGELGAAAATPEFLAQLLRLQAQSNQAMSSSALEAFGELGAATPEFLAQLAKLLAGSKAEVRSALDVIRKLGAAAASPDILMQLAKLLVDTDSFVCHLALEAVGKLGAAAATPDILLHLPKLLVHSDGWVSSRAISAVGYLGLAAATPDILAQLAKLLAGSETEEQRSVALAIGELGAAAATPEILAELARLLTDSNEHVRNAAAIAVGALGAVAATPDILAHLPKLLADGHNFIRKGAVAAVFEFGSAAATPEFLAELARLLTDSNEHVRNAAAIAVGALGAVAATPDILAHLTKLLADKEKYVRDSAAFAVGNLGVAAATPDFLAQLRRLLADTDEEFYSAANAFGKLATATTPNTIVEWFKLFLVKFNHYNKGLFAPLIRLASLYLCESAANACSFSADKDFHLLSTVIIVGSYLSGNTSFNISHNKTQSSYHLCGFADKTAFNLTITHEQAQWFIYWTPQVINSLDAGTLYKVCAEIQKAGMQVSTQKAMAWFDQSSSSSSSSSSTTTTSHRVRSVKEDRAAYGLTDDAIIDEASNETSNAKKCALM